MKVKSNKFFETKEFQKLQQDWYKKLKDNGFNDHEKIFGAEPKLIRTACYPIRHHPNRLDRENWVQYYLQLSQGYEREDFKCDKEKLIMYWLSEGARIVEVKKWLEKWNYSSNNRDIVLVLRKYEQKWGIRKWSPKQLMRNYAYTKWLNSQDHKPQQAI